MFDFLCKLDLFYFITHKNEPLFSLSLCLILIHLIEKVFFFHILDATWLSYYSQSLKHKIKSELIWKKM